MSGLRRGPRGIGQRISAARGTARMVNRVDSPGIECTRTALGERLGIAALYGGHGDADNARAAALLAVAELPDTPANRARVLSVLGGVRTTLHHAVQAVH